MSRPGKAASSPGFAESAKKMNMDVVETTFNGIHSKCCGDDFYLKLPMEKVHQKMKERADSMPCQDVCVYSVSHIKSMHIGGKAPRHLIDLLMGETTEPQIYDTIEWRRQLQDYIDSSGLSLLQQNMIRIIQG